MLVLLFGLYNYRLTMSRSDCHIVTFQSAVRSVPESWDRYSKRKLKLLFKRSDSNLDVFFS